MSEISVVGLGSMGSAIARTLQAAGKTTTVWNRTRAKMQPLLDAGASGALRVADAVAASPLIVTCVDDYTVTRNLLASNDVVGVLAGRTLIEISTGTPQEAREAETWAQAHGADYLDGTILTYPEYLGRADTRIVGPLEDDVASVIVALDATAAEVAEAQAWRGMDDALAKELNHRIQGRVAEVYDLLVEAQEGEEDR